MAKTSNSVLGDPSVKGETRRLIIDLNQLPVDIEEIVDLIEQPRDNVPPPAHFYIDLCFLKEDMEVLKQKYKVLRLSSVATTELKHLGFDDDCRTLIFFRDKRVRFPREFLYAKARSWFKKGPAKEYQPQDTGYMMLLAEAACELKKAEGKGKKKINDDNADDLAAKVLLQDFVRRAKARHAKKKGKKVQSQSLSTSVHFRGKKFVPKRRNMSDIMASAERVTLEWFEYM